MGHSARFTLLLLVFLLIGASFAGCARWAQPRAYGVKGTTDPNTAYQAVQGVVAQQGYRILKSDDAARSLELRTHTDESTDKVTTITVKVDDGGAVTLTPAGFLVRPDGTVHKRVDQELATLETAISERLGGGATPPPSSSASASAASGGAPPTIGGALAAGAGSRTPEAWVEPASDTARWGTGNFTCLPVHIPAEDTSLIALKLSTGEIANVTLSLAYDAALCRSPAVCGQADGCPALGIGDTQQVQALAQLVGSQKVSPKATLLYKGQATVLVDLSRHGSIAQGMGQQPPAAAAP